MVATHGSIGEFNSEKEMYTERLEEYLMAIGVEAAEKQSHTSKCVWCVNIDQRFTYPRAIQHKELQRNCHTGDRQNTISLHRPLLCYDMNFNMRAFRVDREIDTAMLLHEEQSHRFYSTPWV